MESTGMARPGSQPGGNNSPATGPRAANRSPMSHASREVKMAAERDPAGVDPGEVDAQARFEGVEQVGHEHHVVGALARVPGGRFVERIRRGRPRSPRPRRGPRSSAISSWSSALVVQPARLSSNGTGPCPSWASGTSSRYVRWSPLDSMVCWLNPCGRPSPAPHPADGTGSAAPAPAAACPSASPCAAAARRPAAVPPAATTAGDRQRDDHEASRDPGGPHRAVHPPSTART